MRVTLKMLMALTLGIAGAALVAGCTRDAQAMGAYQLEQRYGVWGAYQETISTPDGPVTGTLVPVSLANGRQGDLFIPQKENNDPHAVYLRDEQGLHPVALTENATREELVRAPAVLESRAEPPHPNRRSWEQEALIIGGSAGAGTAIGALTGGKKGAAVGATAGGVGGLIYDLVTRKQK
jgi:hypothetical protein